MNIEAFESSEILQIKQKNLYRLFEEVPKINRVFKVNIEYKYFELQNRVKQTFSLTAEQQKLEFLEQYSSLSNRYSNSKIASYSSIIHEFLNKIRKNLTTKS